jgi:hypothetical protein
MGRGGGDGRRCPLFLTEVPVTKRTKLIIVCLFVVSAIVTLIGCSAEQTARWQQTGQDISQGKPIVINVPYPSTTQPSALNVPTSAIPYHELIGAVVMLATLFAGSHITKKGAEQGAEQALAQPGVPISK